MNKQKLTELLEWFEGIAYVEYHPNCKWHYTEYDVHWNSEDYQFSEDLDFEYSAELLRPSPLRKDGFVIMNVDNGCGDTITMIFDEDKEV